MFFAISKILWWLTAPLNFLAALLGLSVLLQLLFKAPGVRRVGLFLSTVVSLTLLAVWFLPVGSSLLSPLENRFQRPVAAPEKVDGIIILGGALDMPPMRGRDDILAVNESGERILEMVRLAHLYPDARILYTSGSGMLRDQKMREADEVRAHVAELGLDMRRFLWERASRNTYENAAFSKALANPKPDEVWLLVTSAFHTPRSMGIFRKVGWKVVAWPVDFRVSHEGPTRMDALGGMDRLNTAIREWIGLTAYHFSGKTDTWFPAPES
ncbi:MAG TPA: YdcF family protein [Rhodospirillaceae bacterium]|nr:MAG: hypothetical protein A2018_04305 [Alphaproteobacteria bacterium GWF2_58_20]HAU28742.1 YdcF family protein [Rhodospirillaceae bacterium]